MITELSGGLYMRSAAEADLMNMLALRQAYELENYGESDSTLEDLRIDCTAPTFDMAEQTRLVFDASDRLICTAYFYERSHIHYHLSIQFLPGYENAQVRESLIAISEEWARRDMLKSPENARIFLGVWVSATNKVVNAWYNQRSDFKEVRRFWDMRIDLTAEPPAPAWPEGVELRPFDIERHSRLVFDADEEIFSDHWGHLPDDYLSWRHWTVDRSDFDPSLWFVAWAGTQIAGISLCSGIGNAWVGTLGVARPWRGQGLGLALLNHSFGAFYRRGWRKVGLGVDSQSLTGAARLYERAGMYVAQENVSYEKELRAGIDLSVRALEV